MKIFTIESETNDITVHATAQDAEAVAEAERFRNEAGLVKLAANWPANRLVDIWNSLPGATPVKKFKDRNTAVARIWRAIQSLTLVGAQEPADEATEPTASHTATPEAPQSPQVALASDPSGLKATRAKKPSRTATGGRTVRNGSKANKILQLLQKPGGTTLRELMTATGWQAHSVRGFLSGTLRKKMGLDVKSTKGAEGQRGYSVKS